MASGAWLGLSLNASSLSTNIESLSSSERLASTRTATSGGTCAWQGYLNAGDIIRPMTDGTAAGNNALVHFTIAKQSTLKQVSVNPNSKVDIPSSEVRLQDCSARGSTNTGILRFGSISNLRGDAFTIENTAANGTSLTFTKAGKVDVSVTMYYNVANSEMYLSLNQAILTSVPTATEALAGESTSGNNDAFSISWSGTVKVGDVLRVSSNNTPLANRNFMQVFHQELSVGVGVSNTLPQFSESDSCVRVVGANGYGSTNTSVRRFSSVDTNLGTDIVYTDSASLGGSFTVAVTGIYSISFSDTSNVSGTQSAISIQKNSTTFSQTADSTTLAMDNDRYNTNATIVRLLNASWTGTLVAGDVIRAVNDAANVNGASAASFTISKVGKPNVTGVDVTPFVNIPLPNTTGWQPVTLTSTWTNLTLTGAARRNGDSMDLRVFGTLTGTPSSGQLYIDMPVFNGAAIVVDSAKIPGAASNYVYVSSGYLRDAGTQNYTPVMAVYDNTTRFSFAYGTALNGTNPTSPFTFASGDFFNISIQGIPVVGWDAVPNQLVSPTESFSTDTALLTYAGSAAYTLSTLANAPVGTFITFSKGTSNVLTQTTTAPTQTTSDMNINGILTMLGVTGTAVAAATPGAFAIQIGKGLKGVSANVYRLSGKTTAGSVFGSNSEGVGASGIPFTYNERTGVLFLTTCSSSFGTVTSWGISFEDNTSAGNGTQVYVTFNASKSPALTGVPLLQPRIATISDVKASATDGGTATAGSYQTRTLNTLSDPTGIVTSLASNQFVLSKGEYYIEFAAPAYWCESHKAKLRNVTDSTDAIVGQSMYIRTAGGGDNSAQVTTQSIGRGTITISSPKTFEIQHRVAFTVATIGYGINCSFGDSEIYTQVQITKIKD
jgi:hypothetical protein